MSTTEKEDPNTEKLDESLETELIDEWMIRQCSLYKDEYNECTSIKGRFHQYFIYGETLDCNQWKKDYNNCCKWVEERDLRAAETLIESEKARRYLRLQNHYRNDIWKKRDSPPSDWDKPLPDWITKRDENTYLALKAKELKEGSDKIDNKSTCSVITVFSVHFKRVTMATRSASTGYLIEDPKYSFLKDLGLEKHNVGVFNGQWKATGD
ncbi:UPF0545 protein C22orf39 homolog, partial [Eumeta japonica]